MSRWVEKVMPVWSSHLTASALNKRITAVCPDEGAWGLAYAQGFARRSMTRRLGRVVG